MHVREPASLSVQSDFRKFVSDTGAHQSLFGNLSKSWSFSFLNPDLVGIHSLWARGAMALKLHGELDTTIMKMGRWSSLTFLMYIHNQTGHLSKDLSTQMHRPIPFLNVAAIKAWMLQSQQMLDLSNCLLTSRHAAALVGHPELAWGTSSGVPLCVGLSPLRGDGRVFKGPAKRALESNDSQWGRK